MPQKTKASSRAAAEEDKKRKDLHEDSNEAPGESEEEVNVAPSRKAKKVPIGDVPAAPAEPDARAHSEFPSVTPPRKNR